MDGITNSMDMSLSKLQEMKDLSKAQYQWLTAKVTHHRNKYNSKGDCEIRESSKRDPDTEREQTPLEKRCTM